MKTKALAPIPAATQTALAETSSRAAAAFGQASSGALDITAALQVAESIEQLRSLMDQPEIRDRIVALQDTPIGFRTDRDPTQKNRKTGEYNQPYPWPVVRDCALEAGLRGLQLVGNQMNIISGRMYCTKEGFEYLIKRCGDVTDFQSVLGVPKNQNGGALIECSATWTIRGKKAAYACTIPVKTDDYSGADQILGKATRKFLKRCYEQMSGLSVPDSDADEVVVSAEPTRPQFATRFLPDPAPEEKPDPKAEARPATPAKPAAQAKPAAETKPAVVDQPELVPTDPDPAPANPLEMDPLGPQAELQRFVIKAGHEWSHFEQYMVWAQLATEGQFSCFAELPKALAAKMVASKNLLLKMLAQLPNGGGR